MKAIRFNRLPSLLATLCILGGGVAHAQPKNATPQEIAELRAKANQGEAKAQFQLGTRYATGDGVQQDFAEALKWIRKAAEQDFADAQSNLGVMYLNGQGTAAGRAKNLSTYC